MSVKEPDSRLLRLKTKLGECGYGLIYKKVTMNTEMNAVGCINSLKKENNVT
jgi:hypothetical protein